MSIVSSHRQLRITLHESLKWNTSNSKRRDFTKNWVVRVPAYYCQSFNISIVNQYSNIKSLATYVLPRTLWPLKLKSHTCPASVNGKARLLWFDWSSETFWHWWVGLDRWGCWDEKVGYFGIVQYICSTKVELLLGIYFTSYYIHLRKISRSGPRWSQWWVRPWVKSLN